MVEESVVREKAYALWEKDGSPQGAEEFYWRLAQEQLQSEAQAPPPKNKDSLSRDLESSPDASVIAQQP